MPERRWEGGYIRQDKRGRDVYVIRRKVRGKAFKVSTRCHTARAALEHLARFEADPEATTRAGGARRPDRARSRAGDRVPRLVARDEEEHPQVGRRAAERRWSGGAPTCAAAISGLCPWPGSSSQRWTARSSAEEDARARPQDRHAQGALRLAAARAAPPHLHRGSHRRPRRAAVPARAAADAEGAHPRAGAAGGRRSSTRCAGGAARSRSARGRAGPGPAHDRLPPPPAPRCLHRLARHRARALRQLGAHPRPRRDAGADGTAACSRRCTRTARSSARGSGQVGAAAARALARGGRLLDRAVRRGGEGSGGGGRREGLPRGAPALGAHLGDRPRRRAAAARVARHKNQRTTKKFYAERGAPPNVLARLELVK
jgi:hypothetical protein